MEMLNSILSYICLLVLSALCLCEGAGHVTPMWNMYKWGPHAQAWCRFPCRDKLSAGQIFRVTFSGPTSDFTTYGNLRLLAREGNSYLMESNYDIWTWGDSPFCQFQFGLVYKGIDLQGNCSSNEQLPQGFQLTNLEPVQGPASKLVDVPKLANLFPAQPSLRPAPTRGLDFPKQTNIQAVQQPLVSATNRGFDLAQQANLDLAHQANLQTARRPAASRGIDLAMWDNRFEPSVRGWRYQGRCTFSCLGSQEPGTLAVRLDLDTDTSNFNGFGAFVEETISSFPTRSRIVVNRKRVKSQYGLCNFDFELDHRSEYASPTGTCYVVK